MYAAIWRNLPGPVWFRILLALVALAAVLASCALWIFPWIDSLLGAAEGTVGS